MYSSKKYKISRNAYTAECAFEYFVSLIVADSFLARLLTHLGMSDSAVGIISSLISLSFLFQLFTVPVLRKIKKKKNFSLFFHILGQLSFGLIYLIPFIDTGEKEKKAICVIFILLAYFGNYFVNSYIYYLGNSYVSPDKLGIFSGRKEMISLLSGVFIQLVSGLAVDRFIDSGNTEGAFIFCSVSVFLYSAFDLITLILISNRDKETDNSESPPLSEILQNTLGKKDYRKVLYYTCIYKAAMYAVVGFVGTYKLNELGMSMTKIQVINIAACLGRFAFSPLFGKYSDKHSFISGSVPGLAVMALSQVALMFTIKSTAVLVIVYTVLYNISLAGTHSNSLNMTYNVASEKYFSEALAIKNALSGLVGFFSSVICGKILSAFQAKERTLAGLTVYGQQLLALIGLLLTVIALIYLKKSLCSINKNKTKGENV